MATTMDWATQIFTVYQADMIDLGGGVYQLDVEALKAELGALNASEEGMAFPDIVAHKGETVLSGVTYARFVEIINGYTMTISPAGPYQVICTGANHNLADVYNNLTGPTLIPGNSAGLIVKETAVSGLTPTESAQLATAAATLPGIETDIATIQASVIAIQGDIATIETNVGFIQVDQSLMRKILQNRKITFKSGPNVGKMVIYDDDDTTVLLEAQIWEDENGTIPYQGSGLERQNRLDTP